LGCIERSRDWRRVFGPDNDRETFGFLVPFTSITGILGVVACMLLGNSRSCFRGKILRP